MQASFRIKNDDISKNIFLFDIISLNNEIFASMYWEGQSNFCQCFLETSREDMLLQYDGEYYNQNFSNAPMQTPVIGQTMKMKQNTRYWLTTSGNDPTQADLRYSLNRYNAYARLSNLNLTSYDTGETIAMDFRAGCIAGKLDAPSIIIMVAVDNEFIDPTLIG